MSITGKPRPYDWAQILLDQRCNMTEKENLITELESRLEVARKELDREKQKGAFLEIASELPELTQSKPDFHLLQEKLEYLIIHHPVDFAGLLDRGLKAWVDQYMP